MNYEILYFTAYVLVGILVYYYGVDEETKSYAGFGEVFFYILAWPFFIALTILLVVVVLVIKQGEK